MASYSTYARVIMSNSDRLANLICKYSVAPSDNKYADQLNAMQLTLLSEKQIEEAMLNPQNALKPSIAAYGDLCKAHRGIVQAQQNAYEQRLMIEEGIKQLRDRYAQTDKEQQKDIVESVNDLEKNYKVLTNLQNELNQLEEELKNHEAEFMNMVENHDIQWEEFRQKTLVKYVESLEESGIPLSEHERNELLTSEIWPQVVYRYQQLGLEIPSYLHLKKPNVATYFELKCYLAIQASLGRRMLPNSTKDIQKLL